MTDSNVSAVERSKRIAIGLCFLINLGNLALAFLTDVPQLVIVLSFVASFLPYIIHLHYVSPRLMSRGAREQASHSESE